MTPRRARPGQYIQTLHHLTHLSPRAVVYFSVAAVFVAALGLGYTAKFFFRHWRAGARSAWGEISLAILEALPVPIFLLVALYTVMEFLTLPGKYEKSGSELIFALGVVVIFYFITKVVVAFLRHLSHREPRFERITQPSIFVVRLLFIILATIIIFENLGIHLVALWTTLGVGSIAIALSLQETLSNVFAGLYIMADQPVGPGDYVKLDSGQEGTVTRIGWRATALRTLSNNIIFIPNASLAKAVITNYSMPEERMALSIGVSVSYESDADRVEKLLVEIAQEAARNGLEGLLTEPPPTARLIPGFGASSLDFSLNIQVRRFVDQYFVQSELRKIILTRFNQEGISMPFPTRSILLDKSLVEAIHKKS